VKPRRAENVIIQPALAAGNNQVVRFACGRLRVGFNQAVEVFAGFERTQAEDKLVGQTIARAHGVKLCRVVDRAKSLLHPGPNDRDMDRVKAKQVNQVVFGAGRVG